jgi:hypothetical protein
MPETLEAGAEPRLHPYAEGQRKCLVELRVSQDRYKVTVP